VSSTVTLRAAGSPNIVGSPRTREWYKRALRWLPSPNPDDGKPRISAGLLESSRSTLLYLPVPVRLDVCGLLLALSLTLNCPVLVPVACGVNLTLIVHLLLAGRLVAQVVVDTAKSPVVEIAMLVRAIVWLLVSVNVFAELVVPTVCAA
jgi:hypothetical protein